MNTKREKELVNMDIILKSILRRQIPFLTSGTITGIIMTYYYGFPFTIVVNSAIWYGISYVINKYYLKNKGLDDQKYLIQYALSKINRGKWKKLVNIWYIIIEIRLLRYQAYLQYYHHRCPVDYYYHHFLLPKIQVLTAVPEGYC